MDSKVLEESHDSQTDEATAGTTLSEDHKFSQSDTNRRMRQISRPQMLSLSSVKDREEHANTMLADQQELSLGISSTLVTPEQPIQGLTSQAQTPIDLPSNSLGDRTVVHQEKNGTITVQQSSKKVGAANISFVSVSPTKKSLVDGQQIKHIKAVQETEGRKWQGLQIQYTGRPGLTGSQTNRKHQKISEYMKMEDDRFKLYLDLLNKVRDSEDEKQLFAGSSAQVPISALQDKLINHQAAGNGPNGQTAQTISQGLRAPEFVNFKPPKDMTLINRDGTQVLVYTKPSTYEQTQFDMFFKMHKADARLVKAVFETNGFGQTEGHEWNVLWSSTSLKPCIYENLNEYQKVNHFPGSSELTRKDRLCENVVKAQEKFGKEAFSIIPDSYILPDEFADFYSHFHNLRSKEKGNTWIIKPQNSSQGRGIYIIDDISEVPIDEACLISRYVPNPLLINGLKFDLRLYVCVTSMDPWRIYIYHEGLARFASEPYDMTTVKGAKYAHLTNFSINKKNDKYQNNTNADLDDSGHKWSLAGLNKHLDAIGVDQNLLWSRVYDVILKSLLCVDSQIQSQLKKMSNKSNCFELLGYDVLIDADLKPWLMEINLSPSLATESPIDLKIKSQLFLDTINLVCLKRFDRRRESIAKMKNRFKNIMRAKSYQSRQNYPNSAAPTKNQSVPGGVGPGDNGVNEKRKRHDVGEEFLSESKRAEVMEKLAQLNPKVREILRDTLMENSRKSGFIRIYPARLTDQFDQYFSQPKPTHKLLYKLLFTNEIMPFQQAYPVQEIQAAHRHSQAIDVVGPQTFQLTPVTSGDGTVGQQEQQLGGPTKKASTSHTTREEDFTDIINQPYGPGRVGQGRTNTTAKGQKRHENKVGGAWRVPHGSSSLKPQKTGSSTVQNAMQVQGSTNGSNTSMPQVNQTGGAGHTGIAVVQDQSRIGLSLNQQQSQPHPASQSDSGPLGSVIASSSAPSSATSREKLLITGDDVLIEYVHRLMIAVRAIKEAMLKPQWKHQIEKFIKHYVWHTSDVRRAANNKLWQRLESRLIEMKERRKRLLQNIYLREKDKRSAGTNSNLPRIETATKKDEASGGDYSLDFQREYESKEAQKNVIIQGFSAGQLEEMLRTSTRNVAYEVISCLIDASGKGVLTEIIKFLTISNKHIIEMEENGSSILDSLHKKSHNQYGRHHNRMTHTMHGRSRQGDGAARVDEEEDDTESYANVNVGLTSSSKKAYFVQANASGANQRTQAAGTELKIKIRKNSIENPLSAGKQRSKANVRHRSSKDQPQHPAIGGSVKRSLCSEFNRESDLEDGSQKCDTETPSGIGDGSFRNTGSYRGAKHSNARVLKRADPSLKSSTELNVSELTQKMQAEQETQSRGQLTGNVLEKEKNGKGYQSPMKGVNSSTLENNNSEHKSGYIRKLK